jgi:DNA polymerase-3 subunit epsilon
VLTASGHRCPFDPPETPLSQVTFVVLDLETTGASPADCGITEIGAVKYRGGECLGVFETLVNPREPIPAMISALTGITEPMVRPAPTIDAVLPAFMEFVGGAVLVGHNLRFDLSFLDTALVQRNEPALDHHRVDTLGIARRLVRDDEVRDHRLTTLARHLHTSVAPCHRALADARATADVLHALLERAGSLGVLGLDDLLAVPSIHPDPCANKLRLTARIPRRPGVYRFRGRTGKLLYVGHAANLRARVRGHFHAEPHRKVPQMLRETEAIEWDECADERSAAEQEARLVAEHAPRFNRRPGRSKPRRKTRATAA